MLRARNMLVGIPLLMFFCFLGCSKEEPLKVKRGISARVGEEKITQEYAVMRWNSLNESQKNDFKGPDGRARFLDKLIEEEMIYLDALDKRLQFEEDTEFKLETAKRQILIADYYDKVILPKVEVSEGEIKAYYDGHPDEFMTKALIRAQHVFSEDSMKCVEWKRRIENGEPLSTIAKNESEDKISAAASGSLGYFNPGGYIKSIGFSEKFSAAVEKLEQGELSDVIPWERGFSIVRVNEKEPSKLQPISEVRKRIEQRLQSQEARETYNRKLEDLRRKFNPENYERERVAMATRTPEELWEIAQLESKSVERIQYYRDLVNMYPDHKYAAQALFMIGFVYAEELKDLTQARRTFDELLKKYPDSDVVESAQWMIDNLYKQHPEFESIEDLRRAMEEEKVEKEGEE